MIRIGVDFGGTKIEAAAIDAEGGFKARIRRDNPRNYDAALATVASLVAEAEALAGVSSKAVGVGIPGSMSPTDGRIRFANSTWLNGRRLDLDLEQALDRKVFLENDANCFALSEALPEDADKVVAGVIIGTGCGSGLVVRGQVQRGANAMAGEIGHTPLPWADAEELAGPSCWCGRGPCIETFVSGTGFEAWYKRRGGQALRAPQIIALAEAGDPTAQAAYADYVDRLARSLAVLVFTTDPDVIALGGGMSNVAGLPEAVRAALARRVYPEDPGEFRTELRKARHGDSSGVRGAAWLVPE